MSTLKKKAPLPERFIVLLRHGIAEERTEEKKDEDRSLTAEGHARMKQIALGLERVLPKVQAVYSSPLLRAMQTALWVSKAYRARVEVTSVDALAPEATAKAFRAFVAKIEAPRAVLVGHEPSLTHNLRALLGLDANDAIELKKGGCYGIRIGEDGRAVLEWMLPPRILRKLAR